MKFLVVVVGLLSASQAVPLENAYGIPAKPVEIVNLPVVPPPLQTPVTVVEQRVLPAPFVPTARLAPFPLIRSLPAHFLQQPQPLQQVRVTAPQQPFFPTPLAPTAPLFQRALPFAAPAPIPAPISVPSSQFHAQDEFGGFSFGYNNVNSERQEVRTPDGVTRGAYSYVDANGIPQTVEYTSDPIHGFRVSATNLPVAPDAPVVAEAPVAVSETAEVAEARANFELAFKEALARNAADEEDTVGEAIEESRKKRSVTPGYGVPAAPLTPGYATPAAPVVTLPAPLVPAPQPGPVALPLLSSRVHLPILPSPLAVAPAPIAPAVIPGPLSLPSSQYHAQDEFGGASFGYQNSNSARQETREPNGVTRGSYSYVDANGVLQTTHYVADALGFRVAATNLPVAPVA